MAAEDPTTSARLQILSGPDAYPATSRNHWEATPELKMRSPTAEVPQAQLDFASYGSPAARQARSTSTAAAPF